MFGGPTGLDLVIGLGKGVTLTETSNPSGIPPPLFPKWEEVNVSGAPANFTQVGLQSSAAPWRYGLYYY